MACTWVFFLFFDPLYPTHSSWMCQQDLPEGGHQCVGLPEAISQKRMDVRTRFCWCKQEALESTHFGVRKA
eukprot:1159326-Pelagomonas_calceolata.AAC.1